jgi:hypothetical protein
MEMGKWNGRSDEDSLKISPIPGSTKEKIWIELKYPAEETTTATTKGKFNFALCPYVFMESQTQKNDGRGGRDGGGGGGGTPYSTESLWQTQEEEDSSREGRGPFFGSFLPLLEDRSPGAIEKEEVGKGEREE